MNPSERLVYIRFAACEHLPQTDFVAATVWAEARAAFGLPMLDAILGGLTRGSSPLMIGHLGAGKTLLGPHFSIAGALVGEPTVFLGFRETYCPVGPESAALYPGSAA